MGSKSRAKRSNTEASTLSSAILSTPSTQTGHRIAESLKTCESKAARKDGYASLVPFTGSRLDIPAR